MKLIIECPENTWCHLRNQGVIIKKYIRKYESKIPLSCLSFDIIYIKNAKFNIIQDVVIKPVIIDKCIYINPKNGIQLI